MLRVLFICIGNACRSPMAEAIARRDAADVIEAASAGVAPLGFVAQQTGLTLVAFARRDRHVVYANPHRLTES